MNARKILRNLILTLVIVFYSSCSETLKMTDRVLLGMSEIGESLSNLTNLNQPQRPKGDLLITSNSGNFVSENGFLDVEVSLTLQPTHTVTVPLVVSKPSEASLNKYSLEFTPENWNTPQTLRITGVDDQISDGNQDVDLVVNALVSEDSAYSGHTPNSFPFVVLDNMTYSIALSTMEIKTTEFGRLGTIGNTADLYVVLGKEPSANVVISSIVSGNTSEGTLDVSSLTFTPTNWNVPQRIRITGVHDGVEDGNKTFTITLSPATSADANYNNYIISSPSVTNYDMDSIILVSPISMQLVRGGDGTWNSDGGSYGYYQQRFQVYLKMNPSSNVTIPISSGDASRATVDTTSLTFTPTNGTTPQYVTVSAVVNGPLSNTPVSIQVGPASGDTTFDGKSGSTVQVSIVESGEHAQVVVSPVNMNLVEGGDGTWSSSGGTWGYYQKRFSVKLKTNPTSNVTIPITVGDPTRVSVDVTSLTFTPSNGTTPQYVIVSAIDNSVIDPIGPILITIGPSSSSDLNYDQAIASNVTVNIEDNDGPGIRVSNTNRVTTEAGQNATFQVKLNTSPGAGKTVTLRMDDLYDTRNVGNREGSISPKTINFTSLNWSTPQTVTVTPTDDNEVDGSKQWLVYTLPLEGNDTNYIGIKPRNVTVTNTDNDIQGLLVKVNGGTAATLDTTPGEQNFNGMATDESGNFGYTYSRFEIRLRSQPLSNVTITLSNSNPNIADLDTISLLFTPSNWNVYQEVRVTGKPHSGTNHTLYEITTSLSSSDTYYTNSGTRRPKFTIRSCDNDANDITWCTLSGGADMSVTNNTTEGGGKVEFYLITKISPPTSWTINLTSSDTTEGTVTATRTLSASNYNQLVASNLVTVTGVADELFDGNVAYNVTATGPYTVHGSPFPFVNVEGTQRYTVSSSGTTRENTPSQTATITVKLAAIPSANVVMAVSCGSAIECSSVSPTSLTFTPANYNVNQTVTVVGGDDIYADGNQSYNVNFTVTSADTNFNGYNFSRSITNEDDELPAKAVFVTTSSFNGELGAMGVLSADALCNAQTPKPTGTFKALLVTNASATNKRIATTTGTDATGQENWVLLPNRQYYLWTTSNPGGITNTGGGTPIFTTNSHSLFTSLLRGFSTSGTDTFWTGLNANLTTRSTSPGQNNCDGWTYVNEDGNPSNVYYGVYGTGNSTDMNTALSTNQALCSTTRKIICVQQ